MAFTGLSLLGTSVTKLMAHPEVIKFIPLFLFSKLKSITENIRSEKTLIHKKWLLEKAKELQ